MSDARIPFGIHRDSGKVVEPEDALSGRACHCLCPGCHAPLLSRHPKVRRIHFAHDSKHPDAKPDEPCPFSSAVAIAMMARELAAGLSGHHFRVPKQRETLHFPCCQKRMSVDVATSKSLKISRADVKPVLDGVSFDLALHFGESSIYIDLYHRGKPHHRFKGGRAYEPKDDHAGILAVDCDSFNLATLEQSTRRRFSEVVKTFLLSEAKRHWLYHPRRKRLFDQLKEAHVCAAADLHQTKSDSTPKPDYLQQTASNRSHPHSHRPGDTAQPNQQQKKAAERRQKINDVLTHVRAFDRSGLSAGGFSTPISPTPDAPEKPEGFTEQDRASASDKHYHCTVCHAQWQQDGDDLPHCPKCQTHLYARLIQAD